jgi:hypothetical protein
VRRYSIILLFLSQFLQKLAVLFLDFIQFFKLSSCASFTWLSTVLNALLWTSNQIYRAYTLILNFTTLAWHSKMLLRLWSGINIRTYAFNMIILRSLVVSLRWFYKTIYKLYIVLFDLLYLWTQISLPSIWYVLRELIHTLMRYFVVLSKSEVCGVSIFTWIS